MTPLSYLPVSAAPVSPESSQRSVVTQSAIEDALADRAKHLVVVSALPQPDREGSVMLNMLDVEHLSEVTPCKAQTRDIADSPTGIEISALLSRYSMACNQQLASALESIYAGERRDPKWAVPLEERIWKAAAAIPGLKIEGSCRASLCRFDFQLSGSDRGPLHSEFDEPLIASLSETRLAISTVDVATPRGYVKYFCSNVAPAAFVGPLRREMEGERRQ